MEKFVNLLYVKNKSLCMCTLTLFIVHCCYSKKNYRCNNIVCTIFQLSWCLTKLHYFTLCVWWLSLIYQRQAKCKCPRNFWVSSTCTVCPVKISYYQPLTASFWGGGAVPSVALRSANNFFCKATDLQLTYSKTCIYLCCVFRHGFHPAESKQFQYMSQLLKFN